MNKIMKKLFLIITCSILLSCQNNSIKRNISNYDTISPTKEDTTITSIKIEISDVKEATDLIKDSTFDYAVNRLSNNKIEYYTLEWRNSRILPTFMHPFVASLHYGFAQHRPVVISPDMVWLMILQGFSKHVQLKHDSLKTSIININATKDINIQRNDYILGSFDNDWASGINEIIHKLKKETNTEVDFLFNTKFSTTKPKELLAFQITLMKSLDQYFNYTVQTFCGIPYVILEGKPEDWDLVYENFKKLKKYNLDFWVESLEPILDKIRESARGKIDKQFWRSIYKIDSQSGGSKVTGWIIRFFPYLNDGKLNPYLVKNFDSPQNDHPRLWGLSGDDFGSGITACKFKWEYFSKSYQMQFCAGFVGIYQNKSNKSLRSMINWYISHDFVPEKKSEEEIVQLNNKDYSNWIFENKIEKSNESDFIKVKEPEMDTLYYKICKSPEEMPIYKPYQNKSFKEGWDNFLNDISKTPFYIKQHKKIKLSILVTSSGKCIVYKVIDDQDNLFYLASTYLQDLGDWKPGKMNNEIVLTELIVEIPEK